MNFKLDENVPLDVVEILSAAGHDVATVQGQRLSGTTDERLAAICWVEQRALVTLDLDFSDVRLYPPIDYVGLIILRPHEPRVDLIIELVRALLPVLTSEDPTGCLWVVNPHGVRIRQG